MSKPIRILVVEDSLLDAELVLMELGRAGLNFEHHRVDTEPAYLARLDWPPDIILSDFEMPQFNGMRALELLNASSKEIPFIIISGSIGEDLAVLAMKNGATDYLLKDRLARLGSCVTHALDQNRLRREKQAALQASEERFRQMAENIGEVFWMTDVASNEVLYVSPAFERVWGVPCDNLYANPRRWIECVHPEDQPRVIAAEAGKLVAGGYNEEYRIIRPDGSVRWVHDSAFPIRNAEGKVYRVAGVASDITVRKQADLEVAQQRQRLAGIIDSAMDGIITINEEQRVVVFNPAAERMFGYKAEQMLGQTLDRLLPDRARSGHSEHISRFGKTGISSRTMGSFGSITGLRATGEEFPIEASISQVQLKGQRLFTVTCRDVTEQRLTEEKRRLLEAQLQQSQKMEAFGQLAGGIAHDFNNLLVVITGYAEILSSRRDIDDDHRESVEHILTSAHQAATLTRQLLAFSRKQVLEFKVLDLNNVVGTLEKMLRRLIGEDITLTTSLGRDIERVRVD
ncbi:MAG TPA: PAS domain S-box protein, partial [Roseimicrobium sp.]|nr:PAS domain S-box protein [Roseimicrobium sp.]